MNARLVTQPSLSVASYAVPMQYACRVSSSTVLCFGALNYAITSQDVIEMEGMVVNKPYLGTILADGEVKYTACLFSCEKAPDYLHSVVITRGRNRINWSLPQENDLRASVKEFASFLAIQSPQNLRKLLALFIHYLSVYPAVAADTTFSSLMYLLRHATKEQMGSVTRSCWVTERLLYIEGEAALPLSPATNPRLVITAPTALMSASMEMIALPHVTTTSKESGFAGLIYFPREVWEHVEGGQLALQSGQVVIPLAGEITGRHPLQGQLLPLLMQHKEPHRTTLRNQLCAALLNLRPVMDAAALASVLPLLQHYITPRATSVYDNRQPVGGHIEQAFSLGEEGVFVSGWLWDPLQMVASITLISDLGQQVDVTAQMQRQYRGYVNERYEGGAYASDRYEAGFIAFYRWTAEEKNRFAGIAQPAYYSATIKLKSGLEYRITPERLPLDAQAQRDALLRDVVPFVSGVQYEGLVEVIARLQAAVMAEVKAKKQYRWGNAPAKPPVSVIIPLYQTVDFLRTQMVAFAGDAFMRECEIIYVLDSPEQEQAVAELLKELATLNSIAVTLVVMERNSGYAAASNAGAKAATAPHLLFMNSDVLPTETGWLETLSGLYKKHKKIGAMGCKLVFDDGSLQHAGMYYTQDADGAYHILHYAKGYGADDKQAAKSRQVPAVTGALLLIASKRFEEVGGFSTDYIIGDYEDSDLCLKLYGKGYPSVYEASVTLMHAERQSISHHPVHDSYVTGINRTLHDRKWHKSIAEVMKHFASE